MTNKNNFFMVFFFTNLTLTYLDKSKTPQQPVQERLLQKPCNVCKKNATFAEK